MTDVVVYTPGYDVEHDTVLAAFAKGAKAEIRPVTDYRPCDVAVIYGLAKRKIAKTMTKAPIIAKHQGFRQLIVIDSAPILRGKGYWQVGWGRAASGAPLGRRNDFRNDASPWDRWKSLDIELKAWQVRGPDAPIMICGQVPWDANVQDSEHLKWCLDLMMFYSECKLNLMFRPHPRMKAINYGVAKPVHDGPLEDALAKARIMVTFNSTVGTDAVIAGVPTIAMDEGSFAYDVAGHDSLTMNPSMLCFDRNQWAANLAYCVWNLEELRNGTAWAHLSR